MEETRESNKPLRMMTCHGCGAKVFLPRDLQPLSSSPCPKCDYAIMMPMHLRQFELRDAIASGGMGTVYRAYDVNLEREVAIKLMQKELAEDPEGLEGFYREARACASLNHTNIIHIYTFEEFQGQLYLAMELADRGSLDLRIEKEKRIPELDTLDIGIKVASALDLALKHNLLHRDIKPGNILFNADGEPKLVDFGLAISADAKEEAESTVWGTPYYIAPEKVNRQGETFLSDLYSLAGTLYHGLTGHVPFEAPTVEELIAAQVHTPLTPPHEVITEVSQETSDTITCAMAKDPAARFKSYDEFIMALTAARSQLLVRKFTGKSGADPGHVPWWKR